MNSIHHQHTNAKILGLAALLLLYANCALTKPNNYPGLRALLGECRELSTGHAGAGPASSPFPCGIGTMDDPTEYQMENNCRN